MDSDKRAAVADDITTCAEKQAVGWLAANADLVQPSTEIICRPLEKKKVSLIAPKYRSRERKSGQSAVARGKASNDDNAESSDSEGHAATLGDSATDTEGAPSEDWRLRSRAPRQVSMGLIGNNTHHWRNDEA